MRQSLNIAALGRTSAVGLSLAILTPAATLAQSDGGSPTTSDRARQLVAEMLADAQTRSSLVQSDAVAGHDGRFFIRSDDGRFRLNIGGQLQFRYNLNFLEADEVVNDEDFESGFTSPRTRVFFTGNVEESGLFYRVMLDFRQSGGVGFLQDAWAGYDFDNGWQIRAGQGITAFLREWYMGDFKLFSVERSLQSLVFGQFRSQFFDAKYQNDDARFIGTFSDGFRSANTDFDDDPAEWALTGRAEWKFAGAWSQLIDEHRSPRGSDFAGALGVALHYEQGPDTGAGDEQGLVAWTADLLIKGDGWNAMLAGVGFSVQDEAGVSSADFDDYGLLGQFGIHVTDKVELVARYDVIIPDKDRTGDDPFNTLMLGFNYYTHGQAAKFSLAAYWFLDETTDTIAGNFGNTGGKPPTSTAFGSLPSAEENQIAIMAQFQLLF